MNCWIFGRTHHKIFYRIWIILSFLLHIVVGRAVALVKINISQTLLLFVWRKSGWMMQYCVLHLMNFQQIRSDCDAESTGKSHGGGTYCYINERWCTGVTVLKKMCRCRNALHQLQAVIFSAGDLFVHSRECLHSSASARELSFAETRWSDHRQNKNTRTLF